MLYFKSPTGEVFAYETHAEREQFGPADLVQMTEAEVRAHLNPPAPPAAPRTCTPLEFIERFTEAEQLAVVTAAMQVPALRLWYDKLMAAQQVVEDDPRLAAGLDALVSAGLITQQRRDEVMVWG